MTEPEITPQQEVTERLEELEQESQGHLEGIKDRTSGFFWTKVKDFFGIMFAAVWSGLTGTIEYIVGGALKPFINFSQKAFEDGMNETIRNKLAQETDTKEMMRFLDSTYKNVPILGIFYHIFEAALTLTNVLRANMSGEMEEATQEVLKQKRPSLLPFDVYVQALFKDPTTKEQVENAFARFGFKDDIQDLITKAAIEPLPIMELRDAFLRGEITEDEHDAELKRHRLDDSAIKTLKTLYQIIPPVNDIIAMAVREVFTPEIVQRFGQLEDFPEEFAVWAKKKGLTPEWAKNYWAAHWSLPSPLQGFEMLHRGVIEEGDLNLLLKALDIMPFWRDKLTEIAYNPLTRVDVRRMHKIGVLDDEQVKKAYKDLGYNDHNAGLMSDFTIKYNMVEERDLSKTDVLDLFKRRVLNAETAKGMLVEVGYTEDNADLILLKANYEIYNTYKKTAVTNVRKLYVAGKITESEALGKLGPYNLPAEETNELFSLWDIEQEGKIRELTIKDIQTFYGAKVITIEEVLQEIKNLGYDPTDTQRFYKLITMEVEK